MIYELERMLTERGRHIKGELCNQNARLLLPHNCIAMTEYYQNKCILFKYLPQKTVFSLNCSCRLLHQDSSPGMFAPSPG